MREIVETYVIEGLIYGGKHYFDAVPETHLIAVSAPSTDFVKAIYDVENEGWNEGASAEELAFSNSIKIAEKENDIIKRYNYLMIRALSSSMQKYGSYEYLQNQKNEYDEKYLVAKGLKVSIPLTASLEKEMNRDFTDASLIATLEYFGIELGASKLENFYKLIIFKYEYAENRYETFKAFCVDYRTKCRTFLELNQLDKLSQAFAMADTLPSELTDEQIQTLYNQFDAL